jgi:hypothetical protein
MTMANMNRMRPWAVTVGFLMATVLLVSGCPAPRAPSKNDDPKTKGVAKKEEHPEKGMHGGALAEFEDEEDHHFEFTVDHAKKQAIVYILDSTAKKAVPIAAETVNLEITSAKPKVELTLKADPQESDPKGKSSRFVGTHDELGKEVEFAGELSVKLDGKKYGGKFKEEEGHEHGKKK